MRSPSNASMAVLAAIITVGSSGFAVGAAVTSARDSGPEAPTTTEEQAPATPQLAIAISKFAFDPLELDAARGTTVTWTNADDVTHNVFTSDGSLASPDLERGDSYSTTLEDAEVIEYFCDIHQYMRGRITVTP